MPNYLMENRVSWRHGLLIVAVLSLSFSPYVSFDFGFHNDFTIWSYDNKTCCSGFPETPHLLRIGRALQALLQNIYLWFFTDLESLAAGRALGIGFACIGALLLASAVQRYGWDPLTSSALGIAVFLLPPAQVNLGWVTNFIPGLFNAVLVLIAGNIFPDCESVLQRTKGARVKFVACFLLLLSALYIYPPTIGFFLLPTMMRVMSSGLSTRRERLQLLYAVGFYSAVCAIYFLVHRFVYMRLLRISFPEGSLYRFDLSTQPLANLAKFSQEILPVMLNLWNPAPSAMIAAGVLFMLIGAAALWLHRGVHNGTRGILGRSAVLLLAWLALFLAINAPGLVAAGRPTPFYRTWHPGMAALVLLLFHAVHRLSPPITGRVLIATFVLIGSAFSFNSSLHLATTLSNQFKYAVSQIKAQYSPDRERYVVLEMRPDSLLFTRSRWAELGFIHILSSGHATYILKREFGLTFHPLLESVVVKRRDHPLILEREVLERSSAFFPINPSDTRNKPIAPALDSRVDTFFESSGNLPITIDLVGGRKASLKCYRLHAGTGESPSRAPQAWHLVASNDERTWTVVDSRSNQTGWREAESRLYIPAEKGAYKHYRMRVESSNGGDIVRIPELQLFIRANACPMTEVPGRDAIDPGLRESLASAHDGSRVQLVGTAIESGLSDSPFRLQRALDNIYYTFWETLALFPVQVDFRLFEARQVKCYAIQAGDDRAHERMPRDWRLLGSNDYRTWDVLDERRGESAWSDNSRRRYVVASSGLYRDYRIEFLAINGASSHLRLYEMALSEDSACHSTIP